MTITAKSQQILDDLIELQDKDPRVPRAFSESDMIELALRVLEIANRVAPHAPVQAVLGLAVAQFELDRIERP